MSRAVLYVLGVLLALFGAVTLWRGGIPYTEREQVLDIGPVEATVETEETLDVPPLLAAIALAAGVGLLVVGYTRRSG